MSPTTHCISSPSISLDTLLMFTTLRQRLKKTTTTTNKKPSKAFVCIATPTHPCSALLWCVQCLWGANMKGSSKTATTSHFLVCSQRERFSCGKRHGGGVELEWVCMGLVCASLCWSISVKDKTCGLPFVHLLTARCYSLTANIFDQHFWPFYM